MRIISSRCGHRRSNSPGVYLEQVRQNNRTDTAARISDSRSSGEGNARRLRADH
jgi:hypothetical protein